MNKTLKTLLYCLGCFIVGFALGVVLSPVKNGIIISGRDVTISNGKKCEGFDFEVDESWNEEKEVK